MAKRQTVANGNRFSFANDAGPGKFQSEDAHRPAIGWPRAAFAGFVLIASSLVGYVGAGFAPETYHYESRILAIMPEDGEQPAAGMTEVIGYVVDTLGSRGVHEAALKDLGTDPFAALSITQEGAAPVLSISTEMEDRAYAEMAVNYYANRLVSRKPADPGLADARTALNDTLVKARAELASFEARAAVPRAEVAPASTGPTVADLKQVAEQARQRAVAAEKLSIKAVLTGNVPEELMTPGMSLLAEQYAEANAEFEAISGKLGPKHPQYLSAQGSVSAIREKIGNEVNRAIKAARSDLQRAAAAVNAAEKADATGGDEYREYEAERDRLQDAVTAAEANLADFERALEPQPPARFRMISPATHVEKGLPQSTYYLLTGISAGLLAAMFALIMPLSRRAPAYHEVLPSGHDYPRGPIVRRESRPGVLDQIDMLEKAWPETGRGEPMPYGVNDDPGQGIEPDVRELALRLAALRRRAEKAAKAGSQQSLETALADMRRLRMKVGALAVARDQKLGK